MSMVSAPQRGAGGQRATVSEIAGLLDLVSRGEVTMSNAVMIGAAHLQPASRVALSGNARG